MDDPTQDGWKDRLAREGVVVLVMTMRYEGVVQHRARLTYFGTDVESGWYGTERDALTDAAHDYLFPPTVSPTVAELHDDINETLVDRDCSLDYAGVVVASGGSYSHLTTASPDGLSHRTIIRTPVGRYWSSPCKTAMESRVEAFAKYLGRTGRLSSTRRDTQTVRSVSPRTERDLLRRYGTTDPTLVVPQYLNRDGAYLNLTTHFQKSRVEYSAEVASPGSTARSKVYRFPSEAVFEAIEVGCLQHVRKAEELAEATKKAKLAWGY
jgi:hypothetical protein